jgi:signal transduction histidine kinase
LIGTLRRKFVLIVVALVGIVLAFMLGSSLWSTYTTQWQLIYRSLDAALQSDDLPMIGGSTNEPSEYSSGGRLVVTVSLDEEGVLLTTNESLSAINQDTLSDVIEIVLASSETSGRIRSSHVAWESESLPDGGTKIALADTSDIDVAFQNQLITSIVGFVCGLGLLFIAAWWLSSWILRPVKSAWIQQRRFVADASHELKTPLAVIVANMGILQKDKTLSEDSRSWINSSVEAACQMQGLVTNLLELARTDETIAGDANAKRKVDVDFSDMVQSAALEFDAMAFEHGCSIDEKVQEGIHITGDPDWLARLVKILIDNAIKYAGEKTVVTVQLTKESNKVHLVVNDHGQVINPEDLKHVFDRFYRSDKARSRSTGGFGLGLAIAKGIAESHGGSIAAQSNEADGTTFTVTL